MTKPNKRQIPGGRTLQTAVTRDPLLKDAAGAIREHVPGMGAMSAAEVLWRLGKLMSANADTSRRNVV